MSSLRQVLLQCKLGIQCHYTYSMIKFVPIPGLDLLGIIQKNIYMNCLEMQVKHVGILKGNERGRGSREMEVWGWGGCKGSPL